MARFLSTATLSVLLGMSTSCAPVPTAALAAFDGIGYLVEEKTAGDRILSAVADEDCAVHRMIAGMAICQPLIMKEAERQATDISDTAVPKIHVSMPIEAEDRARQPHLNGRRPERWERITSSFPSRWSPIMDCGRKRPKN